VNDPEWKQRIDSSDIKRVEQYTFSDGRRDWHDNFIQYAYFIANHPNYEGMPVAIDDEGRVMWNAPSNRKKGSRFWDLHEQRREWWRKKAEEIGIDPETNEDWISETAKEIHPTGEKVCQTCGQTRDIRYVYLNGHSIRKFNKELPESEQIEKADLLTIFDAVDHLVDNLGEKGFELLEDCFEELEELRQPTIKDVEASETEDLKQQYKEKLEEIVEEQEPHWTSPGAMANPPDRLDGFHSYAICCRKTEDTGRHTENMRMYNADRRAYEQWADGNWAAANKLMNSVGKGPCPGCGEVKNLTADHIGPLSIGFKHMPLLQPLCKSCNSGRNRYWSPKDIEKLIEYEEEGHEVASRHIKKLWDTCKHEVKTDKDARILSNQLRANQHHHLLGLNELRKGEYYDVLICFLEPEHSEHTYSFEGLDPATLEYDRIIEEDRADTFAESRGARMIRIAMDALPEYASKTNRDVSEISTPAIEQAWDDGIASLDLVPAANGSYRADLQEAFDHDADNRREQLLRATFEDGYKPPQYPMETVETFYTYTDTIGAALAKRYQEKRNRSKLS
jgi:Alw26I/Eco31I/Esp3I family type II restriction endonuclease